MRAPPAGSVAVPARCECPCDDKKPIERALAYSEVAEVGNGIDEIVEIGSAGPARPAHQFHLPRER
jgi:hypothetical protein